MADLEEVVQDLLLIADFLLSLSLVLFTLHPLLACIMPSCLLGGGE